MHNRRLPRLLMVAALGLLPSLLSAAFSFAQAPPAVPALPDTERRTSYSLSGTTCACSVGFALYGTGSDVDQWIEVWVAGTRYLSTDPSHGWALTSATGTLATIPRPITNAILTFTAVQTGTVQIVGAERPRRTAQFAENRGVAARDLNQALTDIIAQNRETWDKINDVTGRGLFSQPGNTMGPLPTPSACVGGFLNFGTNGLTPICQSVVPLLNVAVFTPEQYHAVGDGAADDATPWINMCAAVKANGGGHIIVPTGRTYKVWATAPANGSALCDLSSTTGTVVDMQGSTINVAYTSGASQVNIFNGSNISNLTINDLVGVSAAGKHVSGDTIGTNWVVCSNAGGSGFGCRNLAVHRANITGGLLGVTFIRSFGTGQWSWNIEVDGSFTNVGYPFSNQGDGLNSRVNIITSNPGRSYIGYNVWNVVAHINAQDTSSLDAVETAVYGFQNDLSQNLTDVEIYYVNRAASSSVLAPSHQQGDPAHSNIATTLIAKYHVDVKFVGSPTGVLISENSFTGTSSAQTPGDPGNTDQITLDGRVEGSANGSFLGCFMAAAGSCSGFDGTSKGNWLVSLQVPTSSQPFSIGTGASVMFLNHSSPSAATPTLDAGYDTSHLKVVNSIFSTSGAPPADGTANLWDTSGANVAFNVRNGGFGFWYTGAGVAAAEMTATPGNFNLLSLNSQILQFGYNGTAFWNLIAAGEWQPTTDNATAIGDSTHRASNVFGALGTFNNLAGTVTNNSAAAGSVGEYVTASLVQGSAVSLTTATPVNITSISLTAGDWDVEAIGYFAGGGTTTVIDMATSMSTTTGTLDQSLDRIGIITPGGATAFSGGFAKSTVISPTSRFSLSGTTTVFMVVRADFGVSTANAYGMLRARRVR